MLNQGLTGMTASTPNNAPPVITHRGHTAPCAPKRKAKASRYVTLGQLKAFLSAVRFADSQNLRLSVHATIHWQAVPAIAALAKSLGPAEMDRICSRHRSRLLDKLHRWLASEGLPTAYAWVHEVGGTYGEHTHIFIHLPHFMRYGKGTRQDRYAAWKALVGRLESFLYQAGDFKDYENRPDHRNKAVVLSYGQYGMHSKAMIGGASAYLTKAISPKETIQTGFGKVPLVDYLGVRHKGNARATTGRRYGLSHSIGPKAQREAGFVPVSSVEDAYAVLHP